MELGELLCGACAPGECACDGVLVVDSRKQTPRGFFSAGMTLVLADVGSLRPRHADVVGVGSAEETLECGHSFALAVAPDGTAVARTKLARSASDAASCRADWNGVEGLAEVLGRSDVVVFYVLERLSASDVPIYLFIDYEAPVLLTTRGDAAFAARALYGTREGGRFAVVLNISTVGDVTDECPLPETVDFELDSCAPIESAGNAKTSSPPASPRTTSPSAASYKAHVSLGVMDRCASAVEETASHIVYRTRVRASLRQTAAQAQGQAAGACVLADPARAQAVLEFRAAKSASAETSAEAAGALRIAAEVLAVDAVACAHRIVPMARVRVRVALEVPPGVQLSARPAVSGMSVSYLRRSLALDVAGDFSPECSAAFERCVFELVTAQCVGMEKVAGEKCRFEGLPTSSGPGPPGSSSFAAVSGQVTAARMHMGAGRGDGASSDDAPTTTTVTTTATVTAALALADQPCPEAEEHEDASSAFSSDVELRNAKADELATVEMKISGKRAKEGSPRILNVQAVLVNNKDAADEQTVTFDVADKLALMHDPGSAFFDDAHFCRFDACDDFYDEDAGRWNAVCDAEPKTFRGGFKGCTSAVTNDAFFFTPQRWFLMETGKQYTMRVTVVAQVVDCKKKKKKKKKKNSKGRRRSLEEPEEPEDNSYASDDNDDEEKDADGDFAANVTLEVAQVVSNSTSLPLEPGQEAQGTRPLPLPATGKWIMVGGALLGVAVVLVIALLRRHRTWSKHRAKVRDGRSGTALEKTTVT